MAGYLNGIGPVIWTVSARVFHSLEGGPGVMGDHASMLVPGSQITAFTPRVPARAPHHADLLACLHCPYSMEMPQWQSWPAHQAAKPDTRTHARIPALHPLAAGLAADTLAARHGPCGQPAAWRTLV